MHHSRKTGQLVASPRNNRHGLAATSIGGMVLASIPSLGVLKVLYGFWGVTTILLFWSPLIRATRNWGGSKLPGRAFGFLDGGRGLVAAAVGTIAVAVFASLLPLDVGGATLEQRADAFRRVILIFAAITFATSLLIWTGLSHQDSESEKPSHTSQFSGIGRVIRMPTVWLQATVVFWRITRRGSETKTDRAA